jgi:membrane protein YdbS with pleckstrin-like domain
VASDTAKYLLPTERAVINIRRHWAVLAGTTVQSVLLLVIGILLARIFNAVDFIQMVATYFCVFVIVRWIYEVYSWYVEKLVVTDKRLLLLTGIITRNVAIMPLVKVTDLTFHRSATGLMLGYGKFVVESAGQDQALSNIDYVPNPEQMYIQISDLLFGGGKEAPGALVTAAQQQAEQEAERAARRRWRRFTRRRPAEEAVGDRRTAAAPSQLDAILADRDTLLADRDDPDRWQDERSWDRPERDTDWDRRERDDWDDPPREPTIRLPRIHEPRRGDTRGESIDPDSPLPPPRRPRDEPPPRHDPMDD